MKDKNRVTFLSIFLILVVCVSLANVGLALADGGAPTDVPPATTPIATEPPVTETPVTGASTGAPDVSSEMVPSTVPTATVGDLIAQVPQNTNIVILNQSGRQVPLASQEAATIAQTADPIWCPASVMLPTPGANGCTTSFSSIEDLLANMNSTDSATWAANFAQNGIIYLEQTTDEATTITSAVVISNENYANLFNNLGNYDLTIQGGWNTSSGSTAGQTVFSGADASLAVGTSSNPWMGSVTINNITIQNVTLPAQASLSVSSNGTVEMNNVVVSGSGAGQNNIEINASNAILKNVNTSHSNMNGVAITAAGPGVVTLNNVTASNNGHEDGSNRYGSGVLVNGSSTLINVVGGSFTNNARYGIEAFNSSSSTIPLANIWTDQPDYSPGSVVTISGNDNSLNNNNIGFLPGEIVHVNVVGPNGYTASCEGTADSFGRWSCQIILWANSSAVGGYSYTATGLTSGVQVSGTFTDGSVSTVTVGAQTGSLAYPVGGSVSYTVTITTSGGGTNTFATTVSGLPGSVTYSITPTLSMSQKTATLTLNTNQGSTTPAGTYAFSVRVGGGGGASGNGTLIVGKGTPVLSVINSPATYDGTSHVAIVSGSVAGTVSNVQYNGSLTAPVNAGSYGVTANFVPEDTNNYFSLNNAPAGNFIIDKATPVITFGAAPTPTYLGGNFTVSATTTNTDSSALAYSYVSGPCAFVSGATFSSTGAGNCVVQASGAETTNFNAATQTQSISIGKATPAITFGAAPTPTYLGGNFTVGATTTNTDSDALTYGYVSGPCSFVSGSTFSSTGAGTCVVQANGAATTNFNAATQTQSISIGKATPTLSVTNSPVIYDGNGHGADVSGSVPGSVTNVLTGGAATQTDAGTYAVTADFTPGDTTNYESLTGASAGSFVIDQATPNLTVTNSPQTYNGNPRAADVASSVPGSVTNVLTGGAAAQTDAGAYAVTADFLPDDVTNYKSLTGAPAGNFVIVAAMPTITFDPAPSPTYLGGSFTVHATTNSDGALTYSFVSGPCALVDAGTGAFSSTGGGSCVVQANTAATLNFNAGSTQQSVTIAPADPIITFDPAPTPTYLGGNFTVNATTNSDGALTFEYVSGPCSFVSGATFSSTGAGICMVQASSAATPNFNAASVQQSVTIARADQVITVTTHAPGTATYNTSFTVAATSGSGLPVVISSGSPAVCTNSGATFTMVTGTGTCIVQFDQAGDDNFNAAPQTAEYTTAQKADQTITFAVPASPATYNTSFSVSPTSSSGLPVTVNVSGACSIAGDTITMTSGTGICTLTASQIGNTNYNAAAPVIQTVTAQKANPVITWSNPAAIYVGTTLGSLQLNATASVPGTFAYTPPSGTILSVAGLGQILHVDFTPSDTADYNLASKDVTIDVLQRPSGGKSGGGVAGTGGVIPVTGGGVFTIGCSTPAVYNLPVEGFRISFYNLCNFQGTLEVTQASGLPGKLPDGRSYVKGLTVNVLENNRLANQLPPGAQIQVDFQIPANQQNANLSVLLWNGSQWIELTGQKTTDGYFRVSTNQAGTLILVRK